MCGDIAPVRNLVEAVLRGRTVPVLGKDEGRVIEVMPSGVVFMHEPGGKYPIGRIGHGAWGSGSDAARGALAMGASAVQAVRVAGKIDIYTGGRVQRVSLDG